MLSLEQPDQLTIERLGLSVAEAKELLAALQRQRVPAQVARHGTFCPDCPRLRPIRSSIYAGPDYIENANRAVITTAMIETRPGLDKRRAISQREGGRGFATIGPRRNTGVIRTQGISKVQPVNPEC